jgi:hypothetical protein
LQFGRLFVFVFARPASRGAECLRVSYLQRIEAGKET